MPPHEIPHQYPDGWLQFEDDHRAAMNNLRAQIEIERFLEQEREQERLRVERQNESNEREQMHQEDTRTIERRNEANERRQMRQEDTPRLEQERLQRENRERQRQLRNRQRQRRAFLRATD